ncbi:hypothetical protein OUZ56_013355 [Daphnia magna]|uniref:Methionine synthase reductase n=1 Tax=Daphnia magna TaxID=35525 RepID=A0ABQ9Z5M2_9CRUS|nr:hypothetical protein OUZ56_013355 [Daphnia magna]
MAPERCNLFLIYGSQTGQSKSIAEDIKTKAESFNYDVEMMSMDESVEKMPWKEYRFLIIITSSTGDGDPPENAGIFWRKIRSKNLGNDYLCHLEYALLGLGDTNYTTFLGYPKSVEKQLQKLGAKQFYKSGWADDAVGLEIVVDPWIENLWPALENQVLNPQTLPDTIPASDTPAEQSSVITTPELAVVSEVEKPLTVSYQKQEEELEKCAVELANLKISVSPLSECDLKVPVLPVSYLELKFNSELMFFPEDVLRKPMPSSRTPVFQAKIKSLKQLTSEKAAKTTLEATLEFSPAEIEYQPGDSIGVCCANCPEEVDALLHRLNMTEQADIPFKLRVKEEFAAMKSGTKPKYEVPSHLPNLATLRFVLTRCCEIRSVPRKAFIRILAEFSSDDAQKRRLLELCSLQGSDDYTRLVRQPELNVLDFLNTFPSCHPPVERLLEQLPRLLARPYSLSSSPLKDPTSASFIFNVVEFPIQDGRTYERKGVATGELSRMLDKIKTGPTDSVGPNANGRGFSLSVFLRTNSGFSLPKSSETPLILIGPGTGVAPFLGFLAHREELVKRDPSLTCGPIWLFYGCRNRDHDYLFKDDLERWHSMGILTRLLVTFSREDKPSQPKYVQELIQLYAASLVKLIDKGACVYVCGDATNMAKDVMQAFIAAFQSGRQLDEEQAKKAVVQLQIEKRYLQDIWT